MAFQDNENMSKFSKSKICDFRKYLKSINDLKGVMGLLMKFYTTLCFFEILANKKNNLPIRKTTKQLKYSIYIIMRKRPEKCQSAKRLLLPRMVANVEILMRINRGREEREACLTSQKLQICKIKKPYFTNPVLAKALNHPALQARVLNRLRILIWETTLF